MEDKYIQQEQPVNQSWIGKRLLSHKWVVKNIPFFLFLAVLGCIVHLQWASCR